MYLTHKDSCTQIAENEGAGVVLGVSEVAQARHENANGVEGYDKREEAPVKHVDEERFLPT